MGQLGESKYIDLFNAEAQKEFGKNWNELNADDKQKISSRVRTREAYKPRDPSTSPSARAEEKLKKFVEDFKKENKRLPSKKEIQRGANTDLNIVKKYLTEGEDYLTPTEMRKTLAPPVEAKDLTSTQKKWYKANKNFLFYDKNNNLKKMPDDFMSLNTQDRAKVRRDYENRATTGINSKRSVLESNKKTLEDFLQSEIKKVKPGQNIVFDGQKNEFLKKNKIPIFDSKSTKKIFDKFDGRFVFKGQGYENIAGLEKEVIQLAKTKGPKEIVKTLIDEKKIPPQDMSGSTRYDLKSINQLLNKLLKEKKISKIMPADLTQEPKDQLVKKFIKENPDIDNAHQIAKKIADNQNIKMSGNFVKSAVARLGLDKELVSRHAKLYPQVAALDKILKKNSKYILDNNIIGGEKFRFLSQKYAEATNQSLAKATGQLKNRLEKLGSLYQGTSDGRYETKLYSSIKKPIGFNDKFAGNLIEIASQSKTELNNSAIARMMGLPAKDIKLIDDLNKIGAGFDVKMAGDHTDIKALMRDFPNYKKNFLRIQLISDKLNEYKGRSFDKRIIREADRAKTGNPRVQAEAKAEMKKIQKEFKDLTGADIGIPDIRDGRIVLNESKMIPRLDQLKNPRNEIARQAMINLETTAAPGEETSRFTNIVDRLLKSATSAVQRINIFKKYQGTKAIQDSKAVNSLSKLPGPVGKAFKGILAGGATLAVLSTAASAGETSEPEVKQQFSVTEEAKKLPSVPLKYDATVGSIVNATDDKKADQNQILEYVKDNPIKVAAGTSLGFAAEEIPGAYRTARGVGERGPLPKGRGRVRSALGISGALRPVLTTFGTPLVTGLYEGAIAGKRLDEGETMTDILTDPVGPALGVALMEPLSKLSGVVRNAPNRTMLEGAKNYFNLSNVGAARPGITGQILRMGMSPRTIAGASRFLGLPGVVLGAGLAGYDAYKNYQNKEGMIYNLFNKDE